MSAPGYAYLSKEEKESIVHPLAMVAKSGLTVPTGHVIMCHAVGADGFRPEDWAAIRKAQPDGTVYVARLLPLSTKGEVKAGNRWAARGEGAVNTPNKPAASPGTSKRAEAIAAWTKHGLAGKSLDKCPEPIKAEVVEAIRKAKKKAPVDNPFTMPED